jgi:hypothetical protein
MRPATTRRDFVRTAAVSGVAVGMAPGVLRGAAGQAAPSDRVVVAVMGTNSRGAVLARVFARQPDADVGFICDVEEGARARGVEAAAEAGGKTPKGVVDFRSVLDDPSVDALVIAAPDHWHTPAALLALQAGKDVYLEKPVSHNVWEGRRTVEVARQLNRIVQTGTQSRSSSGIAEGIAWVREGHVGKILRARGFCYKRRPSIGKVDGPQPIPPGIDYDLWCGPAPKGPLMRERLHYDWHWVWPTGNGDLGNQGIHQMDMCRWALGETALSPRVLAVGGRLGYVDDGTTPNTMIVLHDYPAAPILFEVRGLPTNADAKQMDKYKGVSIGVVVDCEGGTMIIPNYSSARILDKDGAEIKKFSGASSHFANFIEAVRSRKPSDLNADILEGHLSSALCHTGNISYRLGKKRKPEQIRDAVQSDTDLAEALGRMEEHLAANNVDLKKTPATLGVVLKMDPQTERFSGNRKANKLLTRKYRKPFVVPAKV